MLVHSALMIWYPKTPILLLYCLVDSRSGGSMIAFQRCLLPCVTIRIRPRADGKWTSLDRTFPPFRNNDGASGDR